MSVVFLILPLLGAPSDSQAFAIRTERVYVGTGEIIENGIILIEKGKIAAVGPRLKIPVGVKVIDATKLSAYPGLVLAWSTRGVDSGAGGDETKSVAEAFWPFGRVYDPLLREGFTAVGLVPPRFYDTVAGQGVVVRPLSRKREEIILEKSSFLCVTYSPGGKRRLAELFGKKSGVGALAASGKMPVVISVNNPTYALSMVEFLAPYRSMRKSIRPTGDLVSTLPALLRLKSPCLLPAELVYRRGTAYQRNIAAALSHSKVPVCLLPRVDSNVGYETFRLDVARLIRTGLSETDALKAVTSVPARVLGVDWRIGTIEKGKDADILLLDGNLFDPKAHIKRIYIAGEQVYAEEGKP